MRLNTHKLEINKKRFLDTFTISSSIGATNKGGLDRLALTKEDKEIRDIFVQWLKEAGLAVRIDDFGNIYGRREGKIKNAPSVTMGSHLDTQPTGGRYDGILGVLAALEVIRALNDHHDETDYPIEIINFTNEEGARFRPPMLGSGGLTEIFTKEMVYQSKDDEGILYKDALKAINYLGKKTSRIKNVKNYVELHIEQGPILDEKDISIGIVEGIQGISWLNVKVTGVTNHAGPTPMKNRKDAIIPAARMIYAANELTKQFDGLLTNVGKVNSFPNVVNIVPGVVEFKVDIRHQDDVIRRAAIEQYIENVSTTALMHHVEVEITTDWHSDAVHFSEEVCDTVAAAANLFDYSSLRLFSGAGHDAKYMSSMTETGMIFVKSIDGISHNEGEFTPDEDLVKGANVLLHVIKQLATKK